ncbi:MAG: hypothetical protein PVI00_13500 [Desulfobacterales bacterium]|jgi:hypothetical protein
MSRANRPDVALHKTLGGFVLPFALILVLWSSAPVGAEAEAENRNIKQELKLVAAKQDTELSWLNQKIQPVFGDRVRLNGGVELNYEYLDVRDIDDEKSGSSSDFFMSTAELALRVFFNDWSKSKVVVDAEDYGKKGGDGKVRLDEAIVTLKSLQAPVYFVAGKTVLPFGVFDDHLIEGTVTEDFYEIDDWGATVGFNPDFHGLEVSFSAYRKPQVIENLQNENIHNFRPGRQKEDYFRSFITSATIEPIEDLLSLNAFYNSEPGDGDRNRSIGGAFTLNYGRFMLDAEYITALERELGENEEENKESAGFVGLAFEPMDSLLLATRYEAFWDDTRGGQDEVLDYRIIGGFSYSLLELLDVFFLTEARLMFEYRYSRYEKEADSDVTNSQNMYQVQFVFGF